MKLLNKPSILLCFFMLVYLLGIAQSSKTKPTKDEKKQERKNIDSLFIVYSLPLSVGLANNFYNSELKDSIAAIVIRKGYDCPDSITRKNLIVEKMFDFLPSPVTEKERFKEVMEKVAQDQNYYWRLMELADPFLQTITLSSKQNDEGKICIVVKRQNMPNGKKSREWIFNFDESEPVQNLALRIVETLTNTK